MADARNRGKTLGVDHPGWRYLACARNRFYAH